jgi:hypothetical protein
MEFDKKVPILVEKVNTIRNLIRSVERGRCVRIDFFKFHVHSQEGIRKYFYLANPSFPLYHNF